MSEVKIQCGECGGLYARSPWESAECLTCGKIVYIPTDILPNMEAGEHLIWTNDGHLAYDEAMSAECEDRTCPNPVAHSPQGPHERSER